MLTGIFASGPFFWITTRLMVQAQFADVALATAENWGSGANLLAALLLTTARRRGWMRWVPTTSMLVFLLVYAALLTGAVFELFDARAFLIFGSVSRIAFIPLTVLVAAEGFGNSGWAATAASLMYLAESAALQPVAAAVAAHAPGVAYGMGAATTALAVIGTLLVRRFGAAPGQGRTPEATRLVSRPLFGALAGAYLLLQVGYFARDTFSVAICTLMGVSGAGIGWWSSASTLGESGVALAFLAWPLAPAHWQDRLAPRARRLARWVVLGAFVTFASALAFTALGAGRWPVSSLFGVRLAVEGPAAATVERVAEGYVYAVFGQLRDGQAPALVFDAVGRLIPILGRGLLYLGWSVQQAYLGTAVLSLGLLVAAYGCRRFLAHVFIDVLGGGFIPVQTDSPPSPTRGNSNYTAGRRHRLDRRARRSGRCSPANLARLQRDR